MTKEAPAGLLAGAFLLLKRLADAPRSNVMIKPFVAGIF
jgi:hypothetical protein